MKKVIINGAYGKMGQFAQQAIQNASGFQLIACLGRTDNLAQAIQTHDADIVVDFTTAQSVFENTKSIIEANAHPVIGTSGLMPNQFETLKALCDNAKLGGIVVPNFSIGAILMMHFASIAAKYLDHVEIIEAHHPQKIDAPSGTALKTAELIAMHKKPLPPLTEKELVEGARGGVFLDIPIHAIRLPGFLAAQDVIFGAPGETLSIKHSTIDRACFMPGLLLALKEVSKLNTLHYGLEHLLGL
jgi:4-hydroxy-tetrahydrodipicolinate reductase